MSTLIRIQQAYENRLRSNRNERERITLLIDYATAIKEFDLKKAIELTDEAYHLSVPLYNKKGMAASLKIMGECHHKMGNCATSILKLLEAIDIYSEFTDSYEALALCNKYVGTSYSKIGNYSKAIEHHIQSHAFAQQLHSYKHKASTLNDLALVYVRIKEFEKALACFKACEQIYHDTNDTLALGQTYNNIGVSYFNQQKYGDALQCYLKALRFFRQVDCLRDLGIGLNNIGASYVGLNRDVEALPYLNESLQVREKVGDRWGIAATCINIGESYFNQKKYDAGIVYLRRGINICEELKAKSMLISSHLAFISLYRLTGNNERLLYHRHILEQLEQELDEEKEENRVKNMLMGAELEKALALRKKNTLN